MKKRFRQALLLIAIVMLFVMGKEAYVNHSQYLQIKEIEKIDEPYQKFLKAEYKEIQIMEITYKSLSEVYKEFPKHALLAVDLYQKTLDRKKEKEKNPDLIYLLERDEVKMAYSKGAILHTVLCGLFLIGIVLLIGSLNSKKQKAE